MDGEAIRVALLGGSKTAGCDGGFVSVLALPEAGPAGRGAGSVVVGWGGAEGFLFTVVPHEGEFDESREEEEYTRLESVLTYMEVYSRMNTYIATIETEKQAVSSWQACLKLGRAVTPPFGAGTVLSALAPPVPKIVSTMPVQLLAPLLVSYAT